MKKNDSCSKSKLFFDVLLIMGLYVVVVQSCSYRRIYKIAFHMPYLDYMDY